MHVDQRSEHYLATGFRDVDGAARAKMARCLEFLDSLPSFQSYKSLILDAIDPRPGAIVADLGCGLGFDILRLARLVGLKGRAIGVDSSMALLESARAMSRACGAADFLRADIQNLPLESASLDSCKVDRVLQHIERPASVLAEMFRTVRPGGTVVCAEPDWDTFTIDHDNPSMVRRITKLFGESFRHPWIGRQLSNELRQAGFVDISVRGALLIAPSFESSDKVFDIVQTAERLAESTGNDEPIAWIADARKRDRLRPVGASVTIFLNFARKPKDRS